MKTALIAAVVSAIVAVASGTAATIVVTSKHIKNGTIQTVDLSAKAQRALKGGRGARGAAGGRGPVGPQGAQGPQGLPGPRGVSHVRFVTSPTMTISAGAQGKAEAICPAGETAVAGGFGLAGSEAGIFQSVGVGTSWVAQAENATGADAAQLTAYAYCVPSAPFIP